jgi:hypothetical protein
MTNFLRLSIWLVVIGLVVYYAGLNHSAPVKPVIEQKRPDLTAIFTKGNYTQYADQFGTVARAAFDASGSRIGVQVGKYSHDAPNGMVVEMTYLEPDAEHPLGQAFDGAGNPMPLHTGPDIPKDRT